MVVFPYVAFPQFWSLSDTFARWSAGPVPSVLQCQQAYGIEFMGIPPTLAGRLSRRLVEYLGIAAANGLEMVLDISEASSG